MDGVPLYAEADVNAVRDRALSRDPAPANTAPVEALAPAAEAR